jgi:serine/threonine-protein kinase
VQQVIDQDSAPPSRLNARVPRDRETICLKCLEKDPHRRYATARALAEDLRAWLEGRPMAARRVGSAERAWLWCRRRPAIAALAAAVVLAVVSGTATTIAVQAAANRALGRKNNELVATLGREAAANRRVEQRYELAVEAIQTFHTGVSEDFLLKQDQFQGLRDRLLKSAADFYGKLSALLERETGAASRRALLASRYELAELTGWVGRMEDALAAHRAVLAAREALAAEPGADRGDGRRRPQPRRRRLVPRSDREDGRGGGGLPPGGIAAGGPGGLRPRGAGRASGMPGAARLPAGRYGRPGRGAGGARGGAGRPPRPGRRPTR